MGDGRSGERDNILEGVGHVGAGNVFIIVLGRVEKSACRSYFSYLRRIVLNR